MDFLQMITPTVEAIAIVIDMIGAGLILIGAVKFALRAAKLEIQRLRGLACVRQIRHNRVELGGYILAALEFMIVSDILHTVITHELEDLYFLGLLVLIRTAISYFLGMELKEAERVDLNESAHEPL